MFAPVAFWVLIVIVIVSVFTIIISHTIRSNMEEEAVKEYHDNIEHTDHEHKSNAGDPIFIERGR